MCISSCKFCLTDRLPCLVYSRFSFSKIILNLDCICKFSTALHMVQDRADGLSRLPDLTIMAWKNLGTATSITAKTTLSHWCHAWLHDMFSSYLLSLWTKTDCWYYRLMFLNCKPTLDHYSQTGYSALIHHSLELNEKLLQIKPKRRTTKKTESGSEPAEVNGTLPMKMTRSRAKNGASNGNGKTSKNGAQAETSSLDSSTPKEQPPQNAESEDEIEEIVVNKK